MTRSRQIAMITVAGVLAAFVLIAILARSRPSPEPGPANVASHTTVSPGEVADSVAEVDTAAISALKRMGAYLLTLKTFQLKADIVTEDVRTDGLKVQILRTVNLLAKRPNRLFADIANDRQRRLFFYDGSNFTLYAPRSTFYATVAAPSSIAKLADQLETKFDIELPLVDLFRWGTPEANVDAITAASDLGPSAVNGVTCEQYAFRQDGVDWQLWMQRGDAPLPCRLVITTLTDEARPQHVATYTWDLAPSYNDSAFVFRAPADAHRIPLAEVQITPSSTTASQK